MEEHAGYAVKVPFTTNQKYRKLKTIDDVLARIVRLRDKYIGNIPYVMVQVYLHNTVECKVVCFNGKALYETSIDGCDRSSGAKTTFLSKTDRFKFAETIIEKMRTSCAFAELSSLVRVDVFWCDYLNKMVVNELESLEARFVAGNRDSVKESYVKSFIKIHHANRLLGFIEKRTNQSFERFTYPDWPQKWDILSHSSAN